jgi:hypothetical protein
MLTAYGPFAGLFEPMDGITTPPYLSLLGPGAHAEAPIRLIRAAVGSREGRHCVLVLLRDPNWRAQLVGAVAVYLQPSRPAIAQLWRAFDGGSWVSPQLPAVLSLRDDDFVDDAIVRLWQGCPVAIDRAYVFDSAAELHSAQGPSGPLRRSAKAAAALLALLDADAPTRAEVQALLDDAQTRLVVAEDVDQSAQIAMQWRPRLVESCNT